MRSLPNCTIDYVAAEIMYQATTTFGLDEDGMPTAAQTIGRYLGWALDEIDRLKMEAEMGVELKKICDSQTAQIKH